MAPEIVLYFVFWVFGFLSILVSLVVVESPKIKIMFGAAGLLLLFFSFIIGGTFFPKFNLGKPLTEMKPGEYSIAAFTRDRDYFYVLMVDEREEREKLKYYMISKFPMVGELPKNPIGAKLVVKKENGWKFYEFQPR